MAPSGGLARLGYSPRARDLNVLLGVWLFVSAFVWPHGTDEGMTSGVVGALIAMSAAGAFVAEEFRYLEAMIAGLLIVSALVLPHRSFLTPWNDGVVGLAVIVLSLGHRSTARKFFHRHAHH